MNASCPAATALPGPILAWPNRFEALGESCFTRLAKVLERPFDEQTENHADAALPPDWASHLEVSCSS